MNNLKSIENELIEYTKQYYSTKFAFSIAKGIVSYANNNYSEYVDDVGEINATQLAQDIFNNFKDTQGDNLPEEWADDETCPIWDLAAEIAIQYEEQE